MPKQVCNQQDLKKKKLVSLLTFHINPEQVNPDDSLFIKYKRHKMIKDLIKYFSKKFYASIQCFTIMVILCLISNQSWAQKRQLTASDKINKVAVIDHSRLRKEYKEFAVSKEKLAKENKSEKEKFEKELPSGNRTEITNKYQMNQKKRNQDRITITQEYELKINAAIAAIVSEGGFTEVKSLVKDSSINRRIDITDLVLKKLN